MASTLENLTPRQVIMRRVKEEAYNQNQVIENITKVLGSELSDHRLKSTRNSYHKANNSSVLDYMNLTLQEKISLPAIQTSHQHGSCFMPSPNKNNMKLDFEPPKTYKDGYKNYSKNR